MNITEVAVMLTFIGTLDGRIQPEEATVMAWSNVLDDRIEAQWASDYVKNHYARTGDMIIPSSLNHAWSEHSRLKVLTQPDNDAHCGKPGCRCTHRLCYKGWVDGPIKEVGDESVRRDIKLLIKEKATMSEIRQAIKGRVRFVPERGYVTVEKCVVCRPGVAA
jgi:hypothetical protein